MAIITRMCMLLGVLVLGGRTIAQEAFYEVVNIPLESSIGITITSRDTALLDYYNLYGFQYKSGSQLATARFMVPKDLDQYKGKKQVNVKLCRLRTFINSWQGTEGNPIPVDDYVEISTLYGKEKTLHFNLDPELPDPVYTICGTQKMVEKKK